MKEVSNKVITGVSGKPFKIVSRDANEEVVWKDAEKQIPELRDGYVKDILHLVMFNIDPKILTRQDTIHIHRLYDQIDKSDGDILKIEDAEWDWLKKKLQMDEVGPKVLGANCYAVEECIQKYQEENEKGKEKTEAK